jgi:hypothetical protein
MKMEYVKRLCSVYLVLNVTKDVVLNLVIISWVVLELYGDKNVIPFQESLAVDVITHPRFLCI